MKRDPELWKKALRELLEAELGPDWRSHSPDPIAPWEAMALLWTLNASIRDLAALQSKPGSHAAETAKKHLFAWCTSRSDHFLPDDEQAARLVADLHRQALVVLAANEAAGETIVMTVPSGLSEAAKRRALVAMLLLGNPSLT